MRVEVGTGFTVCIAGMSEVVVESGLNAPLVVAGLWPGLLRAGDLIYSI